MDNYDLFHSKRFSVGLNMENSQEDIRTVLEEYKDMLSSIYFSFPLGRKFYSRTELENEYVNHMHFTARFLNKNFFPMVNKNICCFTYPYITLRN